MKADLNAKIDILEKELKSANVYKGLYDGTLLVTKALEAQLKEANALTKVLVDAMPEVKANLNAGNQNVSVNAKS